MSDEPDELNEPEGEESHDHDHDPVFALYASAAKLAIDRLGKPNHIQHLRFIGDEGDSAEKIMSTLLNGFIPHNIAEFRISGESYDDAYEKKIAFFTGFFYGRALEEFQVMELAKTDEFIFGKQIDDDDDG